MFGYVIANQNALTEEQLQRYRGCYCGLCRSLQERHGELSRLTLSFDMTFLVMFLSSMYEPKERTGQERCLIHPAKARGWWRTRYTDYAADMNVALAYYNCLDDWQDDKKALSYVESKLLKSGYDAAAERWPRQCNAIAQCVQELTEIEQPGGEDPDAAANCFGRLMGELFVCEKNSWEGQFRSFGESLGRFVYMMDACVDLEKDKKRGNYNPFLTMGREDLSEDEKRQILTMLIGECAAQFEKFPLLQDVDIMRNILYSGVWMEYERAKTRKGEGKNDQRPL